MAKRASSPDTMTRRPRGGSTRSAANSATRTAYRNRPRDSAGTSLVSGGVIDVLATCAAIRAARRAACAFDSMTSTLARRSAAT